MTLRPLVMLLAIAGTACSVSPSQRESVDKARIVNASQAHPITHVARYDRDTGACAASAVQLLSRDEVESLVAGWKEPDQGCDGPRKRRLPEHGAYPGSARRDQAPGSAHVLVRLEADGRVESVRAVCATDASFAEAAVETISRIEFSPMSCQGTPTRIAFFLPMEYEYR